MREGVAMVGSPSPENISSEAPVLGNTATAETSRLTLLALPDEALLTIFKYLSPLPHTRKVSIAVSASKTSPKSHDWKESKNVAHLAGTCRRLDILYRCTYLNTLQIDMTEACRGGCTCMSLNSSELIRTLCRLPKLRRIEIEGLCLQSAYGEANTEPVLIGEGETRYLLWQDTPIFQNIEELVLIETLSVLHPLFNSAGVLPSIRKLEWEGFEVPQDGHLWRKATDAWGNSLTDLKLYGTHEDGCRFEESALSYIASFHLLEVLQISAKSVQSVSALSSLTAMKKLSLYGCSVSDEEVRAMLPAMTLLERLDLFDTCVTPNIVDVLPRSLMAFSAGEGPSSGTTVVCQSDNIVRLSEERLPLLTTLTWGGWRKWRQNLLSFASMAPQLSFLSLFDIDLGAGCDVLLSCKKLSGLRLIACDISNRTTEAIAELPTLSYVEICDCRGTTPHGLYMIANGASYNNFELHMLDFYDWGERPPHEVSELLIQRFGEEIMGGDSSDPE